MFTATSNAGDDDFRGGVVADLVFFTTSVSLYPYGVGVSDGGQRRFGPGASPYRQAAPVTSPFVAGIIYSAVCLIATSWTAVLPTITDILAVDLADGGGGEERRGGSDASPDVGVTGPAFRFGQPNHCCLPSLTP